MDPPIAPSLAKKIDIPDKKRNFKFIQMDATSNTNSSGQFLVMCVLCAVCVTASVYSGWKEAVLQNRLNMLESRIDLLERQSSDDNIVFMERFRREANEQFRKGVAREVAATQMLLGAHKRITRDVPECICPAGKETCFV